jgi:hypothetical protein
LKIEHFPKIWLPRTGQVTSYADGDDGYFQAGNPRKTRFYDNGNGTISDRATGLMWVKQPELIIPGAPVAGIPTNQIQVARGNWATNRSYALADLAYDAASSTCWVCVTAHTSAASGSFYEDRAGAAAGKWRQTIWKDYAEDLTAPLYMTWADAVANCLALEYAGFSDWRLTNARELLSVLNFGSEDYPATYPGSLVLQPSIAWTSTPSPISTDYAWEVHLSNIGLYPSEKTNEFYAIPVRGGRINA